MYQFGRKFVAPTRQSPMMLSDVGILLIRILLGIVMSVHGTQKVLGWFGGYGLTETGAFFEEFGFRPGVRFAVAVGMSELSGGILLTLGLFTPFGSAAILMSMLLAIASVQLKYRLFTVTPEIELPLFYAVSAIGIAFTGGGAFSLDSILGFRYLEDPHFVESVLVCSVFATVVTLGLRGSRPRRRKSNGLLRFLSRLN
jgi:putative oxidoreductase